MHERQVVLGGLFITRSDRAEPFESVEKTLDLIALEIELVVHVVVVPRTASLAANDRLHTALDHGHDDAVGVVALIRKHGAPSRMFEEDFGHRRVMLLPWCYRDVERVSLRIRDGVEVGRKSSARTSQRVALDPPFPPDES